MSGAIISPAAMLDTFSHALTSRPHGNMYHGIITSQQHSKIEPSPQIPKFTRVILTDEHTDRLNEFIIIIGDQSKSWGCNE